MQIFGGERGTNGIKQSFNSFLSTFSMNTGEIFYQKAWKGRRIAFRWHILKNSSTKDKARLREGPECISFTWPLPKEEQQTQDVHEGSPCWTVLPFLSWRPWLDLRRPRTIYTSFQPSRALTLERRKEREKKE